MWISTINAGGAVQRWRRRCRACGKVIGSDASARRMRENFRKHRRRCPAAAELPDDASTGEREPCAR